MSSLRRGVRLRGTILNLIAASTMLSGTAFADPLEDGFRNPPAEARPQVWWHWMSGNVSEEGALLDLEWMKKVGIGGIHAFSGGGRLEKTFVDQPLPFMSPGWRAAYRASVEKARSLGMDVTIAGSPGWSQTGGPWVEPANGMKKYVWSEKQVEGGRPAGVLPHPPTMIGPFQAALRTHGFGPLMDFPKSYGEAGVFAFPTPAAEIAARPEYRANGIPLVKLSDLPTDLSASVALPVPEGDAKPFVDIDFGKPQLVRTITLAAEPLPAFEVLASEDGRNFRSIRRVEQEKAEHPTPQNSYSIPPVRTKIVRIIFDRPQHRTPYPGRPIVAPPPPITEIALHRVEAGSAQRVDRFEAKAGFQAVADFSARPASPAAPDSVVDPASVIDLTGKLRADGTLDWIPPAGRWTIVRMGWSLTGQVNNPAELSATGLEVDKLDGKAVAGYVAKLFAMYEDQAGVPLGPKGIGSLLTDSWEAGAQNWTPGLDSEFARLRGYSLARWLPVLTGRVVQDAAASDAFLFDFRQTLKDLVTANHYGVLAKAARDRGMTYYTEAQGDAPRTIGDGLTVKAQADIPTAEFWYRPFATDPGQPPLIVDLQEAASAAHLYGKKLAAAEAMTVAAGQDPWSFSPAMLKPVADEIFTRGINRILIHDSHHQPFVDRKPGLGLGFFGQYFNRNETWAQDARPFTDYLASTSFLLQQGQAVADIAYFYGEEQSLTQRYHHKFNTDVPRGYGYDYVDPNGLFTLLKVRDGRIVTDSGMSYRLIYIPAYVDRMTPKAVARLDALVRAGAVLVGRKPTGWLGLSADTESAKTTVERLWSNSNAVQQVGKGRVYPTSDLAAALRAEGIPADVDAPASTEILSTHRRTKDADIYFLSNRADRALNDRVRFHAVGTPHLWTADDGRIQPLAFDRRTDGTTDVTVPLDAKGAGFVIFRPSDARGLQFSPAASATEIPLTGPWQVSFEKGRGGPERATFPALTDWSRHEDRRIRYFSGGASYSRSIRIDGAMLKPGRRLMLDLGSVHELAVVSIDGKEIATAWKPPYRIDLTGKVTAGTHELTVRVVNLWVNRLIGDAQPGAQTISYAPQSPYKADSKLLPSGLLGPVRLVSEAEPSPLAQ